MVHSSRVPVWMLLLSPPPHLCPLQHRRDVFGVRATTGTLEFGTWICLFICFPSQITLPLCGYFWLSLAPLITSSSWNDCPSWQDVDTALLSYLRSLQKLGALFSSVFNSCFRILKPINPHVILLYFSAFIIILPLSILKSVKRKKRSAQVTTKYTFPKKWHT